MDGRIWVSGASGAQQMFCCVVLFVLWLTSETPLCKNSSQTAMCGVTEAQRRLSGWKASLRSAGGGGFLSRPPDEAAAALSCLTSFDHPHTSRHSSRLRLWRLYRATASCGNWDAEDFPTTAAANQVTETKPQEVKLLKTFWGVSANWVLVWSYWLDLTTMMSHSCLLCKSLVTQRSFSCLNLLITITLLSYNSSVLCGTWIILVPHLPPQ